MVSAVSKARFCPESARSDGYERRRPEETLLYQLVQQHWPRFLERADVFPEVPIRQWVCSLPWRLRYALGYDRRLCADVLGAFTGALRHGRPRPDSSSSTSARPEQRVHAPVRSGAAFWLRKPRPGRVGGSRRRSGPSCGRLRNASGARPRGEVDSRRSEQDHFACWDVLS